MLSVLLLWIGALIRLFRSRGNLVLENLVLRQQLAVLKRRHPRPSLGVFDKFFWVIARRVWSAWKESLIIVTPETVVRWHRTGFRLYRRLISRVRPEVGRRPTPREVRELIFRMVADNPTWGAPRIHGELLMLGFERPSADRLSARPYIYVRSTRTRVLALQSLRPVSRQ